LISHLSIRDFAIIDNLEIDFHDGLNILTGETGAGKSIIIEAVSLALGSRADTAFVRSGKSRALIQLVAEDRDGSETIITREISATGKSSCRINDEIVTLSHLNSFSKKLADIHGQYDHQSLLNPDHHIDLLDAYNSTEMLPLKEAVRNKHSEYAHIRKDLAELVAGQADAARRRDFMQYELQEINSAALQPNEDSELESLLTMLQNAEKIAGNLNSSYDLLYSSDNAALSSISRALHQLKELAGFGNDLQLLSENLSDLYYRLEDIASDIRKSREDVLFEPEQIDSIITRLELISNLKRKYGGSIEKIMDYREKLSRSLEQIDNADETAAELAKRLEACESDLSAISEELSAKRKLTALTIEEKIDIELAELHFRDAALQIRFSSISDDAGQKAFSDNGIDRVEFLIVTNKGESPKPLAKIASGGEISRIMLAFKRIIGDFDEIPTMIFDEIDTGISGFTASVVGRKLADIAKKHQVICITHLPQIAAIGDHNFRILKKTESDRTHTVVEPLSDDEKTIEIARMLAGMDITEHSIKNAEDLIRSLRT